MSRFVVADFEVAMRVVAVLEVAMREVAVLVVAMRVVALLVVAPLGVAVLHAEPSGYVGRTSAETGGCGHCHGSAANPATTVSLQGTMPSGVLPGSTSTFTIIVAHPTLRMVGVNIAVKTTPTGVDDAGDLAVISGQMMRKRYGELTHSSPKQFSGGQVSYTFTWTAPLEEGTYYLQAVGNACDGDGRESEADLWNFLDAIPIVVSAASGIGESTLHAPLLQITPNPMTCSGICMVRGVPLNARHLSVMAMNGAQVFSMELDPDTSDQPLNMPDLPSGTYAVLVDARSSVVGRLSLVVVR